MLFVYDDFFEPWWSSLLLPPHLFCFIIIFPFSKLTFLTCHCKSKCTSLFPVILQPLYLKNKFVFLPLGFVCQIIIVSSFCTLTCCFVIVVCSKRLCKRLFFIICYHMERSMHISSFSYHIWQIFANLMDNMDSQHNLLCTLSVNDKVVLILLLIRDLTDTQSEVSQSKCQCNEAVSRDSSILVHHKSHVKHKDLWKASSDLKFETSLKTGIINVCFNSVTTTCLLAGLYLIS